MSIYETHRSLLNARFWLKHSQLDGALADETRDLIHRAMGNVETLRRLDQRKRSGHVIGNRGVA